MPPAVPHQSSFLAFNGLLQQLGLEHERQIASLEKQINELRAQLGTNDPNVKPGLSGETLTKSPKTLTASAVTKDSLPDCLPGVVSSPPADVGAETAEPGLNWNLEQLPDEIFMASQFAELVASSFIGRVCGVTHEVAKKWSQWWKGLREPDRPLYHGIRDCVDGSKFQAFIFMCIFLNTIFLFYTTQVDISEVQDDPNGYHSRQTKEVRLTVDMLFTLVYAIELSLKLFVHRGFFFLAEDWRWNVFDTTLVVLSLFDGIMTFIYLEERVDRPRMAFLRFLRILKMSKVMRMLRAIRWVTELRLMLDCVLNSVLQLFWCLVLISLVLVIFSLLLVQGITQELAAEHRDSPDQFPAYVAKVEGFFDSVPHAMLTLFKATTGGGDWQDYYDIVKDAGPFYEFIFLFYISFFCIVAWNIVMSTFVEKAFKLAVPDIEAVNIEKRKQDLRDSKDLTKIIKDRLDENHNGRISLNEFKEHFDDPELRAWFHARQFDMKDAELFFHMVSSANHGTMEVDISAFVLGIMRLRGTASSIDVQALHFDIKHLHMKQHSEFKNLVKEVQHYLGQDGILATPRSPDVMRHLRMEVRI